MNNNMDVDSDDIASPPTSGFERSPISPATHTSIYKRPNLDWPHSQRTALNDKMTKISSEGCWNILLDIAIAGDDNPRWLSLSQHVLMHLTQALQITDLKHNVILPLLPDPARELGAGLNGAQLEEWKRGVQKGVKEGDWDDLIAHPILQKPKEPTVEFETQEEQAERLELMFRREYRGNAVESFVRGLGVYNEIYDPDRHYGHSIALLQSSGTGKSRMVQELGKKLPTLSVCFRQSSQPTSGWPPGDEPAYAFFQRKTNCNVHVPFKGEELAAAFIGALAHVTAEKLEGQITSGFWREEWMKDWVLDTPTDVTSSSRFRTFEEVQAKAEALLTENILLIQKARLSSPKLGSQDKMGTQPKLDSQDSSPTPASYHESLYEILCLPFTQRLSKIIRAAGSKRFVIAFDECSSLNMRRSQNTKGEALNRRPSWDMSLIALQRIIKAADRRPISDFTIWYLFLDTNSSIFDLAPSGPDSPSDRLTKALVPLPLWPYLGFNQMVGSENIRSAAHVLSLEHLKAYGRPYWSGLNKNEVLKAATEKLFFKSFNAREIYHVFAAFAVRIGLEIGEGEASERLAKDAVRSHMRILRGAIGTLVLTAAPSEPMLAIAAAHSLNRCPETYRVAIATLLDHLVLRGLVLDRGMQGELCSRLLLTLARDKAVNPFVQVDPSLKGPRVQPVELSVFLETLLGKNLGIPQLHTDFFDTISGLWINFTHFVQLSEPLDEVTLPFLLQAWSSGMAFQCAFLQPVIDGFFVCYAGDLDAPFDIRNLTIIPWQTKAKVKAASKALANELTAPPIVDSDNIRHKPHHLVILMDLAASAVFKDNKRRVHLTRDAATCPTGNRGKWGGYARGDEKEPIRYCLNIRGHSSSTYPVLQGFDTQFGQLFRRLLGCAEPEFAEFLEEMDAGMDLVN